MAINRARTVGLGILIALITSGTTAALAQSGAWGPRAFCTQGSVFSGGTPNCAYSTWEQCMASASGTGKSCTANPFYKGAKAPRKHRPQS
jgi:hypothetical protein